MFDTINYLLFEKKRDDLDSRLISEFSPYMTTRFLSFYENGVFVDYINNTTNKYQNIFATPEEQFRFFEEIIPKVKRKRIQYVKKPKRKEDEMKIVPEFLSKRELDQFSSMIANM